MGRSTFSDENEDHDAQNQFKGLNYMKHLKHYLEEKFSQSLCSQLSGFEVTDAIEAYILSNSQRKCEGVPRDSAVQVGLMLMQEGFIRPVSGRENLFSEDRRSFYRLGTANEIQSVTMLKCGKSRESSRERERPPVKPLRRSSFSRLVNSPIFSRNNSSRGSSKLSTSTPSSSSSANDSQHLIDDEARLFEFALARLLTLVDIPQIEEFVDMQSHCGDQLNEGATVNLLTSILSKMGLWVEEEQGADPVTAFLIKKHRRAQMLHSYFMAVRTLCPQMQLHEDNKLDEYDQVEQWGRLAFRAVAGRLESITSGRSCPLIPSEFTKAISAIAQLPKERLCQALLYLCGMIPYKLRKELQTVLDFIHECSSTDLIFRLTDAKTTTKVVRLDDVGENERFAIDSFRVYILPQNGMDLLKQRYIISTLMEIRCTLQSEVAKLKKEAVRRNSPVPARFAVPFEEESSTDRQLADLIALILRDEKLSQPDKFKKLQMMQTQHPRAYAIYMRNVL